MKFSEAFRKVGQRPNEPVVLGPTSIRSAFLVGVMALPFNHYIAAGALAAPIVITGARQVLGSVADALERHHL